MTADRWRSCCLVAVLVILLCITPISCQDEYDQPSPITPPPPNVRADRAQTNGKTTLLNQSGASSEVLTTLPRGAQLEILCREKSDYIFDDPWWLNVNVPSLSRKGWVADYYCDCGHIGNCNAPLCSA